MPRVVVILPTQSYRAGDFIRAGEQMGIDLIVASEAPPPIEMGDRYLEIDCEDPHSAAEAVVAMGDATPIDGVVAADDAGVVVAALVGTKLGLLANDPDAALAARNKRTQRELMSKGEVPQPAFAILETTDVPEDVADEVGYPLVIKPLDRSAGQGVIRVDRPQDLRPAVARVRDILAPDSPDPLILESYLTGEEVAVEGLLTPDGLMTLAVFDKPGPLDGPGFQETILVTPSRHGESTLAECRRVAAAATGALGLGHGPVHVELMIHGPEVQVIEVAARSIGGLCSRSLSFGLMGTTLESLILRNALGLDKPELKRDRSASGVLMIPIPEAGRLTRIAGIDRVRGIPGITGLEITARTGDRIAPPPEGERYIGFVFARAGSPEEVENALRAARSSLKVEVEPA